MKINCIVVSGKYTGREGYVTEKPNELGLVMFYSKEGQNPYRVCLHSSEMVVLNNEL